MSGAVGASVEEEEGGGGDGRGGVVIRMTRQGSR